MPEPAPAAVVGSSARTDPNDTDGGLTFHSHKLPHRRFIGPIPDSYTSSAGHKVSDHWFSSFKGRVLRDGEEQMLNREGIWTTDHQPALRKLGALANSLPDHVRHPLRPHHTIGEVHRADDQSIVAESILTEATRRSEPPVASGSTQTARHPKAPAKKKKQKKRIERDWHGDSFDVGAEFFGVRPVETRCSKRYRGMIDIDEDFLTTSSSESDQEPNDDSRIRLPRRGTGVTTTTQQSFRTARTHQPGTTAPSLGSRRPSSATGNTQFYSAYSETPNEQMNDDFFAAPQIANSIANSPVTTATTRDGGNHSGGEDPYGSATNLHDLPPALGVSYDPGGVADSGFERTANEGPSTSLPEPQLKAKAIKNKSRPAYNSTLEGILKVARKYRQATGNEGPNGPGEYERTVLPADLNLDREPTRHSGKAVQFPADNAVTSHDDTATIKSAKHRRGILKNTGSRTMREDPKDQAEEQKASANRIKAYDDALDPEEVLARTGSEVAGTSAGVIEANKQRNQDDRVALSRNTTASTMLTSTTNGEKKNRKGKNVSAREAGLNPYDYHQNDNPECAPSVSAVLLRDRMLVRVGRNREVGLDNYDEHMIGRKPCHRLERMQEYLVAYRKGRIELYQEWSAPWAGKWHTTKKLCFTIPLHPKYTKFSLFSSTDLSWSLCLNSEYLESRLKGEYGKKMAKYVKSRLEDTKQLSFLKAGAHNSQVFIFECRERQRAMDWMWEIWKELDGELPVNIDVHIPLLRNTIRLQRPSEDSTGSSKTCRALSRSQILKDCYKALRKGDDFERLAAELKRGQGEPPRMELAWHREGYLDWITRQNETTLDGEKRYWALLAGFAITSVSSLMSWSLTRGAERCLVDQSRHAARLELRPARHSSSLLKLSDGTKLKEPPSIEGYLYWQMSTRSNLKENVYFFSYGGESRCTSCPGCQWKVHCEDGFVPGSLFYSLPKNVEPPVPSHHRPQSHGSQPDATAFEEYMAHEYARGTRNILRCLGFFDFRDIAHVRLKPIVRSGVMKALVGTDDQSESDVEEEREDGMTKKTRAIEVVMERTGRTVTLVVSALSSRYYKPH